MSGSLILTLTGALGLLGVGFGAFGAHALKERLDAYSLGVYQTGVQYLFWHLAPLLVIGLLKFGFENGALDNAPLASRLSWSAGLFLGGIVIFSGSLWLLAFTGVKVLGAITPIGGTLLLAGWLTFLLSFARSIGGK